jgi:hypothetical protein
MIRTATYASFAELRKMKISVHAGKPRSAFCPVDPELFDEGNGRPSSGTTA